MICFKCGAESRVLFTEKHKNRVYRQRKCLGCGRKWHTEEVENSDGKAAAVISGIRGARQKAAKKGE